MAGARSASCRDGRDARMAIRPCWQTSVGLQFQLAYSLVPAQSSFTYSSLLRLVDFSFTSR